MNKYMCDLDNTFCLEKDFKEIDNTVAAAAVWGLLDLTFF